MFVYKSKKQMFVNNKTNELPCDVGREMIEPLFW